MLQGEMRQEVCRFTGRDKGGLLLPTDTDVNTETLVADFLFSKHPNRIPPALKAFHPYVSSPALIDLDVASNFFDRVPNTMKGAAGPWRIETVNCHDWTLHYGPSSRELQESIDTLVWWLVNTYPHWEAYRTIVTGRLIGLDKCQVSARWESGRSSK